MTVRYCADCKHSNTTKGGTYLFCLHPVVVSKDWQALSAPEKHGVACEDVRRSDRWGNPCALKGKLWEAK